MLSFHDPAMAVSTTLYGTQILLGPQAALAGASFSSSVLLRNTAAQSVGFSAHLIYDQNGAPLTTQLPAAPLAPFEVRRIDLSAMQKSGFIPQDVTNAAIQIDYAANPGDVMARIFSISSDRSLGLYTALESFAAKGATGVYWTADESWNTILTVTNFASHSDTMSLQLTYPGGPSPCRLCRLGHSSPRG